ncbi:hypothetical protein [Edaphobacter modestus]|uniref:Uncharacterized protein n=1 Tax=Edaphobacter modestus TaxID=388466 RepID=A0A4Q7YXV7_9BACT|nr:hypothetical protein [Edaphobacter modestus]RZU42707.1 hypothetical protein BDD14_4299 [Edaphobacter modestus]
MQESAQRKISGSAGTIISIAIGLYLQTNPTWGNLHPRLAAAFYVMAGVSCLFAAMQWPFVQRLFGVYHEPPTATLSSASPSIGALTFAPVFNNQTEHAIVGERKETTNSTAEQNRPRPKLRCSRVQKMGVSYSPFGRWDIDSLGASAIVLYLKNQAADHGEKGAVAEFVYASIEFSSGNGQVEAHISKAYWMEEKLCNVNVAIEAEKGILIGTMPALHWHLFENERTPQRQAAIERSRVLPALKEKVYTFDGNVTITVKVIESRTGETLLKHTFSIFSGMNDFRILPD